MTNLESLSESMIDCHIKVEEAKAQTLVDQWVELLVSPVHIL